MQMFNLETLVLLSFPGWENSLGMVLLALFGVMGWGLFIGMLLSRRDIRVRQDQLPDMGIPQEMPVSSYCSEESWSFRFRSIVERRLHEFDLKAEDIARDLGMSRTHFFRQVKQETGMTPAQYLQDARFQRARYLLETSGVDSVKAAAISVGFRNGKYFSRVFREKFGKWPSECLKM